MFRIFKWNFCLFTQRAFNEIHKLVYSKLNGLKKQFLKWYKFSFSIHDLKIKSLTLYFITIKISEQNTTSITQRNVQSYFKTLPGHKIKLNTFSMDKIFQRQLIPRIYSRIGAIFHFFFAVWTSQFRTDENHSFIPFLFFTFFEKLNLAFARLRLKFSVHGRRLNAFKNKKRVYISVDDL